MGLLYKVAGIIVVFLAVALVSLSLVLSYDSSCGPASLAPQRIHDWVSTLRARSRRWVKTSNGLSPGMRYLAEKTGLLPSM
jgi:hypothetical protein